ncbi:MAG: PLD nuclease N-terminal domain-containing protein [Dehalococcoidales bacterium]|nr:PLD nuclease N-terminal domain-containing protein [Dehalococcoidales bacterium]
MEELNVIKGMLPFLIPVALIQLTLLIIALMDLVKRKYVRGGNKIVWALVIVFISMIGPIVYLIIGRQEKPGDGDQN